MRRRDATVLTCTMRHYLRQLAVVGSVRELPLSRFWLLCSLSRLAFYCWLKRVWELSWETSAHLLRLGKHCSDDRGAGRGKRIGHAQIAAQRNCRS